jgi:hypothetical protein
MYLKNLAFFENLSHLLEKASIFLKMSSERIEIFKKASNHFKKASNSLKISLKCHAFSKKASHSQKSASWQLPHCHIGQSAPVLGRYGYLKLKLDFLPMP